MAHMADSAGRGEVDDRHQRVERPDAQKVVVLENVLEMLDLLHAERGFVGYKCNDKIGDTPTPAAGSVIMVTNSVIRIGSARAQAGNFAT